MVDIMSVYAGINWQTAALAGKVMCNFIVSDDGASDAEKGGSGHLNPKISAKLDLFLRKMIGQLTPFLFILGMLTRNTLRILRCIYQGAD